MARFCTSSAVLMILLTSTALSDPKQERPARQIAGMSWLAGEWEGPMWGGTFNAYYCTPEGGKIMSYNTLTKKGKTVFHEFEVFELDDDGVIFRPFPGGKPATPLKLTKCEPDKRKAI